MKPTSTTTAAADLEELRRFALDLEDRHLHGKRANIDDAFKWNQVVRIIGKLAAIEAQQTDDTLSGLRTKIEEIYTPDADFKDQVLELLGEKKGCIWEPLEGVGKLWCVIHDTDHGAG